MNWILTSHILLSSLAYGLLAVAAVIAFFMIVQQNRLHSRQPLGWLESLPALETMDRWMFVAVGLGFALLTLALFSGLFFVDDWFEQHLVHKTVLSFFGWSVFALLLLGRWKFGWRGKNAAWWTLSGFAVLLVAYFGSKFVLEALLDRQWG